MYQHPPITEAVIGITFTDGLSEGDRDSLKTKLLVNYPVIRPFKNVSFEFELDDNGNSNNNTDGAPSPKLNTTLAYRLSTYDMSELVILLPQSLTFSQTAPYPGWSNFYDRFVRDWKIVRRELDFRQIARIGVRYINRIDIPSTDLSVEHENYLDLYPHITSEFGPLSAYAVQVEIFMDDLQCKLTLNSAAVPSPLLNTSSFLLDLDISREINVPQTDEKIYFLINQIRDRKNKVFESCITNEARSLFKYV